MLGLDSGAHVHHCSRRRACRRDRYTGLRPPLRVGNRGGLIHGGRVRGPRGLRPPSDWGQADAGQARFGPVASRTGCFWRVVDELL